MEPPEVIASRLDRAIRPALQLLGASSFPWINNYGSNNGGDGIDTLRQDEGVSKLPELVVGLGSPDAVRCKRCGVQLSRGSRSIVCIACGALCATTTRPSFFSSLAYQRLSKILAIDDLEPNPQIVEAQAPGTRILYDETSTRETSVMLYSMESTPSVEPLSQPSSGPIVDKTLNEEVNQKNKILEYSSNSTGNNLEDFFSSSMKSHKPLPLHSDAVIRKPEDEYHVIVEKNSADDEKHFSNTASLVIEGDMGKQQNSLSLLVQGYQSNTNASGVMLDGGIGNNQQEATFEDDPFSSLEGEFQSATKIASGIIKGDAGEWQQRDTFSVDPFLSWEGEFQSATQGVRSDEDIASSQNYTSVACGEFQSATKEEDPFSAWDGEFQSATAVVQCEEGLTSSQSYTSVVPSEVYAGLDDFFTGFIPSHLVSDVSASDMKTPGTPQWSQKPPTGDEKLTQNFTHEQEELVGSLLSQLHDLSFMLADKLVVKTDEQS